MTPGASTRPPAPDGHGRARPDGHGRARPDGHGRARPDGHGPGGPPVGTRVSISAAVAHLTAVVTGVLAPVWVVPLASWGLAALVFVVWMWRSIWTLSPQQTADRSRSEDPGRTTTDLVLLSASIASLIAVGLVLVQANKASGLEKGVLVSLSVASIIVSWAVVHTVFALRYAALYYAGEPGGVDFNEDDPPDFADFAYLALTLGMTYQVSDTDIKTKEIRRTAVRHALLSFAFGTLIIATTINLVAGLGQ
jgi:uncharacterized membrane protein